MYIYIYLFILFACFENVSGPQAENIDLITNWTMIPYILILTC